MTKEEFLKIDTEKEHERDSAAINSLTDGRTAHCDENDVAELATSSSRAVPPLNGLAVSSSEITASRKRNNESAQNMVANESEVLNQDMLAQQQQVKRPQTRGAPGGPTTSGVAKASMPKGRILSQAFALSHDSYSTIKSNYNKREGADFFTKRQNQRVDRLINRINNSTGKQSTSPDKPGVGNPSQTRASAKYNSTRAIQDLNTIECNGNTATAAMNQQQ